MPTRLDDLPEGLRIVLAAKRAAWALLPEPVRASAVAFQQAQRERARQRSASAAEAQRTIVSLVLSGAAPEAAAAVAGRSQSSAYGLLRRLGIPLGVAGRARRLPQVFVTDAAMDALDAFAADCGLDVPSALARLIEAAAADGAHVARRLFRLAKREGGDARADRRG